MTATASPMAAMPAQAPAAAEERIEWTAPSEWKEMPPRPMRYATLADASDPSIELAVFPLPPQPVLPNVNRWEQQLGLPPTPEADLGKVVTHIDVNNLAIDTVDLLGPAPQAAGQPQLRMLAAIINRPDRSWFFRMVGPADKIAAQKAKFDAFVRTIRPTTPAAPPATQPAVRMAKWDTPSGWVQDQQPRPMRVATFYVTSGNDRAEVIVSQLAQDNVGDLPGNINRWRSQAGLQPLADVSSVKPQQIPLGGATGMLYDFAGPETDSARKRLLVAVAALGDQVWFFKMLGPEKLVSEQKSAFESFLKSTQFVGEQP